MMAPPRTMKIAGSVLLWSAALLTYFLLMILPLVGPAGSGTPYARQNFFAFLGVLLACIVLSGAALAINRAVCRMEGGGWPRWGAALFSGQIVLLLALMGGLLSR